MVTVAATMTGTIALAGSAQADPQPSLQQIQEQVNKLHSDAIKATEVFNGVQEQTDKLRETANRTQARVADEQNQLNMLRDQIGVVAADRYRGGTLPATLSLALNGDPENYLQKAQMIAQLDSQQAAKLRQIAAQARALSQDRTEASSQLAELEKLRTELNRNKTEIQGKLAEAERLLNTVTREQRAKILASSEHEADPGSRADRSSRDKPATDVPASGRAAAAIQFARAQIGKWYGWGKTGPTNYDCSGLTQASWAAANVKLSRVTTTQINDGKRVSKAELQPGDLVFFNRDNSHVGLYIGGGRMIHAPRPGTQITEASIDTMFFYGAVRPG
ncbi:NlpC/P60 family protein [Embleya sp. NPDC001921]